MFGFSAEHLVILVIVLLIVGPRKVPELGLSLGKAYKNFKDGISGVENAAFRKLDENPKTELTKAEPTDKTSKEDKV